MAVRRQVRAVRPLIFKNDHILGNKYTTYGVLIEKAKTMKKGSAGPYLVLIQKIYSWGLIPVWLVLSAGAFSARAEEPQVITLTQSRCQFIEPEGTDHEFKAQSAKDCKEINSKNGGKRLAESKTMTLKPGKYIFRVTNRNVPYELGFYLRGTGIGRLLLPKVAGGGLIEGKTQDYPITLKEGDYIFSCPLNPTPDYKLTVKK